MRFVLEFTAKPHARFQLKYTRAAKAKLWWNNLVPTCPNHLCLQPSKALVPHAKSGIDKYAIVFPNEHAFRLLFLPLLVPGIRDKLKVFVHHYRYFVDIMADKSKPRMSTIYLYVPNIIGYIRVLMNCVAFAICFSHKGLFALLYFVSFVCDGIDGWFARKLNQVSTFGAVLDMVTDRISTACLLVILSQIYRPGLLFLSLLALDIASHWFQMYSTFLLGKASHKDVKDSSNWLFRLYYGNRTFMAFCCVSCEVLYIILFLLAKSQNEDLLDVLDSSRQNLAVFLLEIVVVFGWAVKQIINVIQLTTAADACVLHDISRKQKP